jgi:hypothetical protein
MPQTTCVRCGNAGYTSISNVRVESVLDQPDNTVRVEVSLCASCRGYALKENKDAQDRMGQRGEAG